ncbi:hypothetical protein ILUMI_16209 [Ignelater luminosus]|uniref:Uncharacterized protein n=1 Tax=Ignelater luminosus TaxID=2038154 RepID=A0A8K0G8E8_IGNLU|nr:hypothetical protein ILUMI_16209 [Ignelater luminosus]
MVKLEADSLIELRTYGTMFSAIATAITAEGLQNTSGNVLSFLFKYPISKLTMVEAVQVPKYCIIIDEFCYMVLISGRNAHNHFTSSETCILSFIYFYSYRSLLEPNKIPVGRS